MSGLGGMIADLQRRGISPRQHFDTDWPVPERIVTYSARVVRNPKRDPLDLAGPDIQDPTVEYGDDQGWHLWPAVDAGKRACSAWFAAATPSAIVDGKVVPLRGPDQPDDRFQGRAQTTPSWATQFPGGWTGVAGRGTEEYDQLETWHPDWLGLVAPNKAGSGRFGSRVFDLTPASAVDTGRWAYIQSLLSVVPLAKGGCGVGGDALAIQLGKSGQDRLSGGALFVEWLEAKGAGTVTRKSKRGPSKVSAVGSWQLGSGPFLSGGKGDAHELGTDRDGDPINALHLSTLALWKGGPGDGPLAFTADPWVEPEGDGPIWQRTYARWNPTRTHPFCKGSRPGIWEWETPTWIMTALPPDPPPEVDPQPPRGDPPPPQPPPGGEEPPPVPPPPHPPVGYVHSDTPELIGDEPPARPNYAEIANCLILGGLLTRAHAWGTGQRDMSGTGTISSEDRELLANGPVVSHTKGFAPGREGNGAWWDWLYTGLEGPLAVPVAGAGPVLLPADRTLEEAIQDADYSGPGTYLYFPSKTSALAFGNPNPEGTIQDGVTIAPDGAGDLAIRVWSGGVNTDTYSTADFGGGGGGGGNVFTSGTSGVTSTRGEVTEILEEAVHGGGASTFMDMTTTIDGGDSGVQILDVLIHVLDDFNGSGITGTDSISAGVPATLARWGSTPSGGYVAGSKNTAGRSGSPIQWVAPGASSTIRVTANGFTMNGTTGRVRVSVIYEKNTHPTS